MIAVEVGDKDVFDAAEAHPESAQLHLGTLSAIYQEQMVLDIQYLGGWVGVRSGGSTIATQHI